MKRVPLGKDLEGNEMRREMGHVVWFINIDPFISVLSAVSAVNWEVR